MGCVLSNSAEADTAGPSSKMETPSGERWPADFHTGTHRRSDENTMTMDTTSNHADLVARSTFSRASLDRIEMKVHPLEKYYVLEHLGAGAFAEVKRVRERLCSYVTGAALEEFDIENDYAMKILSVEKRTGDSTTAAHEPPRARRLGRKGETPGEKKLMSVEEVVNEIRVMSRLHHHAILGVNEYFVSKEESKVYVIMDMVYGVGATKRRVSCFVSPLVPASLTLR